MNNFVNPALGPQEYEPIRVDANIHIYIALRNITSHFIYFEAYNLCSLKCNEDFKPILFVLELLTHHSLPIFSETN